MEEDTGLWDDGSAFRSIRDSLFSFPNCLRRRWRNSPGITIEHLWLAAPFFVIFAKGLRVPLPLLDFWWHLKMGEIIASTRSIPGTDLFSFAAAGKPFIVQNWLAEVLYFKLHQLGGLPLLVFENTVLLAAALLPVFLLCRESTNRIRLAAASTLLACLAFSANARPQVYSLVFFAFFYWVLDGYRFQRRDKLWLLPPAMIIWVNLHGAFVVGLGLSALFLGSEGFHRLANSEQENILSLPQLRKLGIVSVACAAATLVNPETYKVYDYIRVVLSDRASQQLVMEWQPPRIDTLQGIQMFFGLFALAIIVLICSRRRPDPTDTALFLGFSIFGLTALRNTVWFAIIIAPVMTRYTGEMDTSAIRQWLQRHRFFDAQRKPSAAPHYTFNLVIAAIALLVLFIASPWIYPSVSHTSLLEPQTPVKAVDFIERHNLQGHIFHPQIFGDYLIWRLYPRQHSFIDGRVHLFGENFVREYQKVFYDSRWQEMLASFDIQYLLLSKDAKQTDSLYMIRNARGSSNWEVLFEDDISILLKRKTR
jgi:hypothetical protein